MKQRPYAGGPKNNVEESLCPLVFEQKGAKEAKRN
jgi:hypothetical protein